MKKGYVNLDSIADYDKKKRKFVIGKDIKQLTINCVAGDVNLNRVVKEAINTCKKTINLNLRLYCGNKEKIFDYLSEKLEGRMDYANNNSSISLEHIPIKNST